MGRGDQGGDVAQLAGVLAAVLAEIGAGTDPLRVHLSAACVEMDGAVGPAGAAALAGTSGAVGGARVVLGPGIDIDPAAPFGVLLIDPDPADRHALVARMLDAGGRYLGADRTTLLPGSRTVFAEPIPLDLPTGRRRASTMGGTRPFAAIGAVVLVERRPGAAASIEALSTAEGCARLLGRAGALDEFGSAALDTVGPVAAGASFWQLVHDDLDAAAALIGGVRPREGRDTVTLCRLDHLGTGRGRAASRMVRFDHGAVLADGSTGQIDAIDDTAADALEVALRGAGRPGSPDDLYGLPDTPRRPAGPGPVNTIAPDGPVGAVPAPIVGGGAAGRVEDVLAQVADLFEAVRSQPVVLGDLVQLHDTAAPGPASPLQRVDLLVDRGVVDQLAEQLEAAGLRLVPHRIEVGESGSSVEWQVPGGGAVVGLHWQLAVGPFGELVDHDELSRRSVPVAIGARWFRALHPEDRFVLACVQVASADRPTPAQMRAVVLSAPRDEVLMASALEASERWGATRTVLAAVRTTDAALPGMPDWLVARARPGATGVVTEETPARRRRSIPGRRRR